MLRRIGAGMVGALVAGVLLGAASRLLMMLVAVAAEATSQFSWPGTAGIVAAYTVAVLPGAVLAAFVRRRGRWLLLALGAGVLLFPAVGVAGEELGFTGHFTALNWALVGLAGLGVFATIGALPVVTLRVVDRVLGRLGVHATADGPSTGTGGGAAPGGLVPPVQAG
jgi:hypothetical protein